MKKLTILILILALAFTVGCGEEEASPLQGVTPQVGDVVAPDVEVEKPTTGHDTNGEYNFGVNNLSAYDIYSIHVGIAGAEAYFDLDILPQILPANSSTQVYGAASSGDWGNQEWTLYITDVDGDTSASYDSFNPWNLAYVDVQWNNDAGGYTTTFYY